MTGFAGFLIRDAAGLSADPTSLERMKACVRNNLSRNPRHRIDSHDRGNLFVAQYDNGAWQANRSIINTATGIAVVSGDPLFTADDGVSNEPAASATGVADALSMIQYHKLDRAAGCFAACHWNSQTGTLQLCADKLANRPIYLCLTADMCLFSTTLRMLRAMSNDKLGVDEAGFAEFVFFGQPLGNRTVFENVGIVAPGTVLEITGDAVRTTQYHSWNSVPACDDNPRTIAGRLHGYFMRAIRRRVRHTTNADAFLTGGLDSRSVVAGLVDAGVAVRGFNYSYPASADDVLGRLIANKLGVALVVHASKPADRLKIDTDLFALNARDHFPPPHAHGDGARLIWSGDGGSVGLGHVYMTADTVAAAVNPLDHNILVKLFPNSRDFGTRTINRSRLAQMRALALTGARSVLEHINPQQADRRLFLFYLLNDQSRHLYAHYEYIDLSDIEFETPFFDMDFLSYVVSTRVQPYLYHKLYNAWLGGFQAPAGRVPWQAYRGHEPCPLPLPDGILGQWSTDWYGGSVGAAIAKQALSVILKCHDNRVWQYLNPTMLSLLLANRAGIHRYDYECHFARKVFEQITGQPIFAVGDRQNG